MKKKTLGILYYENNFHECCQLSKKFSEKYNIVFISSSFFESLTNQDLNHKKLVKSGKKAYSFYEELHYFYKNINKNTKLDIDYIKKFEKKYLKNQQIENIIKFDYFLNHENNPREDIKFHKDKNKKLLLVTLILKKIEKIIITEKIDIFFTMFPANFINNMFYYISKKKKTQFICTLLNRNHSITLAENFGLDFPNFIKNKYSDNVTKKELGIFKKNVKDILLKPNNNLSNYKALFFGLKNEVKRILIHIIDAKRFFHNALNYSKSIKKLGYETEYYYQKKQFYLFFIHLRYILRSLYLHMYIFCKSMNVKKIFRLKYIYIPLHYFPEAYIYNQLNFNELNMVNKLIKNTPNDIYLVIKPHPIFFKNGFEQHKVDYYKSLLKNPRVKIISPYICNINLIKNAQSTSTYTGTSLLQSVLLNKPSFRFGDSELNFFNGIFRFLTKRDYIKDITKRIDNNFNYKLLYLLRDYSVNDKKMNTNNLMQLTNEARDNLVKLFILNFGSKK
jgi:hypothetical protein